MRVELGLGRESATYWTCDFSYVSCFFSFPSFFSSWSIDTYIRMDTDRRTFDFGRNTLGSMGIIEVEIYTLLQYQITMED